MITFICTGCGEKEVTINTNSEKYAKKVARHKGWFIENHWGLFTDAILERQCHECYHESCREHAIAIGANFECSYCNK